MRIAIVSDVHSNLAAFQAALRHAEAMGPIDRLWCPGDVVGYGPDPSACIALLRRYPHTAVAGNHDLAAINKVSTADFNASAARAAAWTAAQLTTEERQYLDGLPEVAKEGEFTLAHGTLRAPVWEYLLSLEAAREQFRLMETPYSIVGHSHLPFWAEEGGGDEVRSEPWSDGERVELGERRLIINPGGVGQPRDGDPRAAYALYDTEAQTLTLHRVEYDIAATQEKMRTAGLPSWLAERLSFGQ
jgi:diadenosine tetraphosphatase ApaH/serine/threonine PP2A family protein phosphatase